MSYDQEVNQMPPDSLPENTFSSGVHPVSLRRMAEEMEAVSVDVHVFYHPQSATFVQLTTNALQAAENGVSPDALPPWEREVTDLAHSVLAHFDEFAQLPTQREIDEYSIMRAYADAQEKPAIGAALEESLIGKGAFRRFRETLRAMGLQQHWHEFKMETFRQIALHWCEHNGLDTLPLEEDLPPEPEYDGSVVVRRANEDEARTVAEIAVLLWPENPLDELAKEFEPLCASGASGALFIAEVGGEPAGFAQCAVRNDYVAGADGDGPVGYLEGLYVKEKHRMRGIGAQLVSACRQWSLEHGCRQMASDCLLNNASSERFHKALGFREVERVICFIQNLEP